MSYLSALTQFCRKHKMQAILFACSIILLVRHSDIPYPVEPCPFIGTIFTRPNDQFLSSLGDFIDIFASAYTTSLIFYFFVDYAPKAIREQSALQALRPMVGGLVTYANRLAALVLFLDSKHAHDNVNQTGAALNEITFENKDIVCKCNNRVLLEQSGSDMVSINPYEDAKRESTNIKKTLKQITESPTFSNAPWELIEIINALSQSDLLSSMHFNLPSVQAPTCGITFLFELNALSDFLEMIEKLKRYSVEAEERDVLAEANDAEAEEFTKRQNEHLKDFLNNCLEAREVKCAFSEQNSQDANHAQ